MDRTLSYAGAIPLIEQFLQAQQQAYIALARSINAVMGEYGTVADGFDYAASSTTLAVTIGPGSLTANGTLVIDPSGFGLLPATTVTGARQYLTLGNTTLTLTAGATNSVYVEGGTAQGGGIVLPYYNASNPQQPYAGPSNSGTSQPTLLQDQAVLAVTTGSVPNGAFLLYTIVVPAGATAATSGSVSNNSSVFLTYKLPQLQGVRGSVAFGSNGTFTVPTSIYRLKVQGWGAGGTGGVSSTNQYPGGGGGAGGYFEGWFSVTPSQVLTITVGAGISGGSATGGSTGIPQLGLLATGGLGGAAGSGSAVGVGGGGGTASGGTLNMTGASGSTGIASSASQVECGMGGSPFGGTGSSRASGGTSSAINANLGTYPGGGSTGTSGGATAAGGNGLVLLEY